MRPATLARSLGIVALVPAILALPVSGPTRKEAASRQVLERYLNTATPEDTGRPLAFEIEASLPRMHKHGIMRGLKIAGSAGRVAFKPLHYAGDDVIKTAVIGRFLAAESKQHNPDDDLSITERNYRFQYKGTSAYNDRSAVVFRLNPKNRRVGMFRGELWLDEKTARPLREWGEFVKSPSVFLSNIYFVRDYLADDTGSRPLRVLVKVRAAFVGPAELTMWLDEPGAGL